ncbi:Type 1 glutamine amidotransferase-like domain-containing protein [Patescibacteria group bacterium]|nr:Type 1 glutamine amidotransferase-like domain-containing protein [Patescibacteria group bacterium]
MKQLFLTSGVHAVAHDISKKVDLSKGNKLVFIDTAAEGEKGDKQWLKNDRKALVDAGFEVADYSITGKSKDELETYLPKFDYIYLSGGNTSYLLQQSQKSGFIPVIKDLVLKKGKTYIGTSAGSIIAGPVLPVYLLDDSEDIKLDDPKGYGFVNFTILPHWGSEDFKKMYLGKRLETVYKEDQVPLLLLTDNQYVHVRNDQVKIVDVNG